MPAAIAFRTRRFARAWTTTGKYHRNIHPYTDFFAACNRDVRPDNA